MKYAGPYGWLLDDVSGWTVDGVFGDKLDGIMPLTFRDEFDGVLDRFGSRLDEKFDGIVAVMFEDTFAGIVAGMFDMVGGMFGDQFDGIAAELLEGTFCGIMAGIFSDLGVGRRGDASNGVFDEWFGDADERVMTSMIIMRACHSKFVTSRKDNVWETSGNAWVKRPNGA